MPYSVFTDSVNWAHLYGVENSGNKMQFIGKILNPICHVVLPWSSDFEDLAGVFSVNVLRENKKTRVFER